MGRMGFIRATAEVAGRELMIGYLEDFPSGMRGVRVLSFSRELMGAFWRILSRTRFTKETVA
jgi:hypothetical protein